MSYMLALRCHTCRRVWGRVLLAAMGSVTALGGNSYGGVLEDVGIFLTSGEEYT